jgi:hypothetical protein
MTSLLNFIKIYQLVQKLLGDTHRQTDRQTGDLISLTFVFKESRIKTSGNDNRKAFNRFSTKNSCTRNITHKESATIRNLKPEWWGSPLVQEEKYQENL